jgi:diguanylate cyclase (GGDEF)-like protein
VTGAGSDGSSVSAVGLQRFLRIRPDELLFELDRSFHVTAIDGPIETMWGFTSADFVGHPVTRFIQPEDLTVVAEILTRMRVDRVGEPVVFRITDGFGELRWVESSGRLDPSFERSYVISRDVTAREHGRAIVEATLGVAGDFIDTDPAELDERIERSLGTFGALIRADHVLLTGIDDGHIAAHEFEWRSEGVCSVRDLRPLGPDDAPTLAARLRDGKVVAIDDVSALPDPERGHLQARMSKAVLIVPIRRCGELSGYLAFTMVDAPRVWTEPEVRAAASVGVLIGQVLARRKAERLRIDAERELARRALHDPLTGLANRSSFLQVLRNALDHRARHPGMLAVLTIDLDRFKLMNDAVGHDLGDEFLTVIAKRLQGSLRGHDVVARLSADEFAVVLHDAATPRAALTIAERTLALLAQPVVLHGQEYFTTASIGVALADDPTMAPTDLLRWAESALHRAKDRGRNRVEMFDVEMQNRIRGRMRMETALRQGVDRGELDVFVQPEVELATGRVLGVEALVRWFSPEYGLLAAGSFIDIAEETGLVVPIGGAVLRAACEQLAQWSRSFPDLPLVMRVNVSPKQLAIPGLASFVSNVIDETRADPSMLCLEITETALMTDPDAGLTTLRALHDLGVSLAIDDFGTGYSSLSYLKRFPIDVMKIDRSFVDGLPFDRDDLAIASTIVRLAEALEMEVTAEGVETVAQAEALLQLGVHRAQGFLYATPMPTAEFTERIRSGNGQVFLP